MDSAETPRRGRRAARRAAGPPAQASTSPVAELPADDDPIDAGEPVAAHPIANPVAVIGAATPPAGAKNVPAREALTGAEPAAGHEVHGSPGDAPAGPSHAPGAHRDRPERTPGTASGGGESPRRSGRTSREEASERSLRSLVTTRSTQVSPTAALRAREVALPSAADLAAAEDSLVVVRRHYVPPTVLATGRRPDRAGRRPSGQDG
jgi:hypothetical protein